MPEHICNAISECSPSGLVLIPMFCKHLSVFTLHCRMLEAPFASAIWTGNVLQFRTNDGIFALDLELGARNFMSLMSIIYDDAIERPIATTKRSICLISDARSDSVHIVP